MCSSSLCWKGETIDRDAERLLTITLMVLALLSPLAVVADMYVPIRVVLAVPTILFSPGYMILATGFPGRLKRSERMLLSVGLSLSITGIWAIVLGELLLPITPLIVGAPLVAITVVFGGIRLWRSRRS